MAAEVYRASRVWIGDVEVTDAVLSWKTSKVARHPMVLRPMRCTGTISLEVDRAEMDRFLAAIVAGVQKHRPAPFVPPKPFVLPLVTLARRFLFGGKKGRRAWRRLVERLGLQRASELIVELAMLPKP
jgi:hypothetical protein